MPAQPLAKRPRLSDAEGEGLVAEGFALRCNSADAPVANPALFRQHPLREEQRRSLAWMLEREARPSGFLGGLLADKMGYGKTATTIGLVTQDPASVATGVGNRPVAWHESYLLSNTTLILCPAHLVQQWEDELVKFLADQVQIWRVAPEPGAGEKQTVELPPFSLPSTGAASLGVDIDVRNMVDEITGSMLGINKRRAEGLKLQVGDAIVLITIVFPSRHAADAALAALRAKFPRASQQYMAHQLPGQQVVKLRGWLLRWLLRCYGHCQMMCPPGSTASFTVLRKRGDPSHLVAVRGQGPLHVLAVATIQEYGRLKQADLLNRFAVMIVSTGILKSERYQASVGMEVGSYSKRVGKVTPSLWADKVKVMRHLVQFWPRTQQMPSELCTSGARSWRPSGGGGWSSTSFTRRRPGRTRCGRSCRPRGSNFKRCCCSCGRVQSILARFCESTRQQGADPIQTRASVFRF